jgi:predicted flap endonuclease-1-like 5' DNA nuclease
MIPRSLEIVRQEYFRVCANAGEYQFKIKAMEHELDQTNQKLVALHAEYSAAEKIAANAESAAKSPEVVNSPVAEKTQDESS